jgi:DNA-binding YbaB/EbfC family protein
MNLPEMLQQARKVQEQMQKQLQELRVEAASGGGMVTVVMNGQKYVLAMTIDPELLKSGDAEMIQDLVMGAVNQASQKVDEQMQQKMGSLLGGLNLPGMNLPTT